MWWVRKIMLVSPEDEFSPVSKACWNMSRFYAVGQYRVPCRPSPSQVFWVFGHTRELPAGGSVLPLLGFLLLTCRLDRGRLEISIKSVRTHWMFLTLWGQHWNVFNGEVTGAFLIEIKSRCTQELHSSRVERSWSRGRERIRWQWWDTYNPLYQLPALFPVHLSACTTFLL